ncbi:MAG: flagellar basal body rod protein FlgB [bacterium]|nr:flagellar basal body rod protein FlgB [bacterium]
MFFENLLNRGSTPALVTSMAYTQARHKVIAENIANLNTPGYKAKQLDTQAFQRALGEAFDRRAKDSSQPFAIEGDEFHTDETGALKITPSVSPVDNILFHDGTNISLEREMSDLAENTLMHQMTSTLLQGRIGAVRKAIRGRV